MDTNHRYTNTHRSYLCVFLAKLTTIQFTRLYYCSIGGLLNGRENYDFNTNHVGQKYV
jgi:hypothetical protein